MSKLDYTIVVPSRKRVHNMPLIMELLPSALICIDEREYDDYAPFVPKRQLLVHEPFDFLANAINFMMEKVESEILIEIDDDFRGVRTLTTPSRFITNPEEILAILENSAQVCKDLGLTTFCYSRTSNPGMVKPDFIPARPVAPVCNAFGVMGAARTRKYNPNFYGRGDVDWTLRTLLEDRAVYADMRFYFDCGAVFGGRGGNVGLVKPKMFEATTTGLKRKWGKYISFKQPSWQKNRQVAAMGIRVDRRNDTAQR